MINYNRTIYNVLGILTIKPSSGYEITKMIKTSTTFFWAESAGQIYPALAKCLINELVTCEEIPGDNKERFKKIYSITDKGRAVLQEWLRKKPQKSLVRDEFLLKLFFADNLDAKETLVHIQDFQIRTRNELDELNAKYNELILMPAKTQHLKYWLFSLEYGIQIAATKLSWCKDVLAKLNSESA